MQTQTRTTAARGYGYRWQQLCIQAYRTYGYNCHLCGKAIDPTLHKTHPMSKSVDHLRPMVVHGTQLPNLADVRPAHRSCNTRRRNQVASQLRRQAARRTTTAWQTWNSRAW